LEKIGVAALKTHKVREEWDVLFLADLVEGRFYFSNTTVFLLRKIVEILVQKNLVLFVELRNEFCFHSGIAFSETDSFEALDHKFINN